MALLLSPIALRIYFCIALFGAGYIVAWNTYSDRAAQAALRAEIVMLKTQVKAAEADARMVHANAAEMAVLDRTIEDLRHELSAKDRVCFDPDDTDRLRQLWTETPASPG